MECYKLFKKEKALKGTVTLAGSKSISNRALIIQALCSEKFEINKIANSKDTQTLIKLLASTEGILDTGAAGTTFRFLTAYLAAKNWTGVLTGSERMQQRPIGELVSALNTLGANIQYTANEGYPPLKFSGHQGLDQNNKVTLPANISSQFISALLLIAPSLPRGLEVELIGEIVSKPYLLMTLELMQQFGVKHEWDQQTIKIQPQDYKPKRFTVEADWSAASYYYSMAAIADQCDLVLKGLFQNSVQGDQAIAEIMSHLGVKTTYLPDGIHLSKSDDPVAPVLEYDFVECPDLAQTVIATCAAKKVKGVFTGLETLYIKETDRVHAMKTELNKIHGLFYPIPSNFTKGSNQVYYTVEGDINFKDGPIYFETYEDHRMAMALAPLALKHPIYIREPMVVVKSYPDFYHDLEKLGFEVDAIQ